MNLFFRIFVLGVVSTLIGCSNITTYKSTQLFNLSVFNKASSGIDTSLHVYNVSKCCELEYIGTLDLDSKKTQTGIPVNNTMYVEVEFFTNSFLALNDKSTRFGTIIKTRKGYLYTLKSQYSENVYDVTLYHKKRSSNKNYELPTHGLEACQNNNRSHNNKPVIYTTV